MKVCRSLNINPNFTLWMPKRVPLCYEKSVFVGKKFVPYFHKLFFNHFCSVAAKTAQMLKTKFLTVSEFSQKIVFLLLISQYFWNPSEKEARNFISIVLAIKSQFDYRAMLLMYFWVFLLENNNCNWNVCEIYICCRDWMHATSEGKNINMEIF